MFHVEHLPREVVFYVELLELFALLSALADILYGAESVARLVVGGDCKGLLSL